MTIFSLKNKKVFILGGSGLIGKPTNDLLIKHGAKLFNLDLIDSNQKKVKFIKFDLKNAEGIKLNLTKIIKKYGCPSIFINCSYPTSENWSKANFSHVNQNIINENLKIHLSTYVFTSNLIAEEMRKRKIKGSIIQFSSIYGMVAQNLHVYKNTKMKENYVYPLIKSAIIANCKQMASYYGKFDIRVNSISPGAILGHVKNKKKSQSKVFVNNFKNINPLKRLAKPNEIAPSVIFLASDASSYITGINLVIDGGWTII